jgi:hypothetical protein
MLCLSNALSGTSASFRYRQPSLSEIASQGAGPERDGRTGKPLVVGVPSNEWGETLVAFIVLKAGGPARWHT